MLKQFMTIQTKFQESSFDCKVSVFFYFSGLIHSQLQKHYCAVCLSSGVRFSLKGPPVEVRTAGKFNISNLFLIAYILFFSFQFYRHVGPTQLWFLLRIWRQFCCCGPLHGIIWQVGLELEIIPNFMMSEIWV